MVGSTFFSREVRRVVTLRQGFGDSVPETGGSQGTSAAGGLLKEAGDVGIELVVAALVSVDADGV
jgi:hypothetical protein